MNKNEIIISLLSTSSLSDEDFFSGSSFYYLAGRFPDADIAVCVDAVNFIRDAYLIRNMPRTALLQEVKSYV